MVRVWDEDINKAIALTKMRIKHHEEHGCGSNVITDKARLQKQERHKKLRDEALR